MSKLKFRIELKNQALNLFHHQVLRSKMYWIIITYNYESELDLTPPSTTKLNRLFRFAVLNNVKSNPT